MSDFLTKAKILLVSPHISHRSGLRKTLLDLGANNKTLTVASDFDQAKEILSKEAINIIVTDEQIGKDKQGPDLLEHHLNSLKKREERSFILLMDAEVTPFALADFILRGGDITFAKPFKNEQLIKTIQDLLNEKASLSHDDKLMLSIEDFVALDDIPKAKELLTQFSMKDSVQYFYASGLINEVEKNLEEAFNNFSKSIAIKPGFKSLVCYVRVGSKLKRFSEMNGPIEAWLYEYPLHHNSITDITRVIIANKKYDLLDQLFKIFTTHNVTDSFARIPLAAGFVMVSTEALAQNNKAKAKEFALKGIEYSNKRFPIILKAIENLVSLGDKDEAEKAYLKNSPVITTMDDQILDMKIRGKLYPKTKILIECMKLIDQNISHPDLFTYTIQCLSELGKDPGEIMVKAKRAFPKIDF